MPYIIPSRSSPPPLCRTRPDDRACLAATDVKEVEKLVGEMHRFLYHNAHNITIGEIHTNYAANKKVAAWNLGRNLYDNNLRYVIRP